jgi:hypothetical protein
MQLWGHVRRSAPLRGPVRRRRARRRAHLWAQRSGQEAAHFEGFLTGQIILLPENDDDELES